MTTAVWAHALASFDPEPVTFWTPYPKQQQAVALSGQVFELLYGGAVGGGKSAMLRGYACDYAYRHPGAHIAIVRRTLPMLKQTHGLHLPGMLAGHARENRSEFTFTFPNGSVIRFISLPNEGDEQNYKSAEFDLLMFDEVTEFAESQYTFMLTRVRSAKGHPVAVIATANPEGQGFRWVKRRWVSPRKDDLAPGQSKPQPGVPWAPPIIEHGVVTGEQPLRAFLPATVYDNPGLLKSNPGYVRILESMPDVRRKRALLHGDWDAMDEIPGALWAQSTIDEARVSSHPDLIRVVVGVDPSGTSQDETAECGIVVAGLAANGAVYVLADYSGSMGPDAWAEKAVQAFRDHAADKIVAERNFGGEMVQATIEHVAPNVAVEVVTASRGKAVRAEPIAVLSKMTGADGQPGRVRWVGEFLELEDQLTTWTPGSSWSPDRLDACFVAGTPVLTARGEVAIEDVTPGTLVWTRKGWRPVVDRRLTARDAAVGTVTFSDGRTLTGTPDHPVWTDNRGWVRLDALVCADTLTRWTSRQSVSSTEASSTAVTRTGSSGHTASTTPPRGAADVRACTVTSGRTTTPGNASLPGGTSTTTTTTRSTMTRATSSSGTPRHTPRSTPENTPTNGGRTPRRFVRWLRSGIAATRAALGTRSTAAGRGRDASPSVAPATSAAPSTTRGSRAAGSVPVGASTLTTWPRERTGWTSSAPSAGGRSSGPSTGTSPRPVAGSVVKPYVEAGRADVYDLMVADVHEFVAAGAVVHNCVWAVTELMGGSAALGFLTALSTPCPECGAVNVAGHGLCFQCGADLPSLPGTVPGPLPALEGVPENVPGALPIPDPDDPTDEEEAGEDLAATGGILPGLLPSRPSPRRT